MHADPAREHCSTCGARLPVGAPAGRCPACLLRLAFEPAQADADERTAEDPEAEATELPTAPGEFAEYELIAPIGRGAMGVVFKARQPSLGRFVALKVLDLAGRVPSDAAKRFRAEASAAAGLRHPGIVTIHEVGVHRGWHYLAMDLIEGATLAAIVTRKPLVPDDAARLLVRVAEAIQCAHERGILHRDLKPSNILVDTAGQPHVADFGLAKRMDEDADLTLPGQIMGSPNYMSPEQARGAPLGPASDVHALGAVLYHCLAGRPPFFGQTLADTLHQVIHAEPLALRLLVAGVPRDLDTIALKCLEKDPAKRYPEARALAEDLGRFLRREPIHARPVSRLERLGRWCLRRPAVAALTTVTSLLVLAVAIGSPIAAFHIRAERERAEDNLYAADMHLAQQALGRSSRSQARALLERHRPQAGEPDRRGFEWRYLWTQSESDERLVVRATSGQRHLTALPGTRLVAAGSVVWDLGPPVQQVFQLPEGTIALQFDPVDQTLLTAGEPGLIVWSTTNWTSHSLLSDEAVHGLALSEDGRWMATGGARLTLWQRPAGGWQAVAQRERPFRVWHNARTLAFSPDSRWLATGTGESWANRCVLELWSVPELERQSWPAAEPGDILSLAFTPAGDALVAGCWNGRIRMWDLDSRTEIETTMRHHGFVIDLAFMPRDRNVLATAASDRTVRLWSLATHEPLALLQGPLEPLWAMTVADHGRQVLTMELDGRIAAWDTGTLRREETLIAQGPCTIPLGFSADSGVLATIDQTGRLRFWDLAQRRELGALAQAIDLTGVLTRDFEIIAPVISPDLQQLAIGMLDGRVQVRHLSSRQTRVWNAHARAIRNAAWSPDGATLATVGDDTFVRLWEAASGTLRGEAELPGPLASEDFNVPLAWSPDGRLLAVAGANTMTFLDGANARPRHHARPDALVFSMRFSPDGRLLVSAEEDFQLTRWDPLRGAKLDRIHASHQEGIYDLCFSPDGRTLATVVDQVKLWNVVTWQEVSTWQGHERNIFAALFSPDGNLLVTADYEGAVRLWSARPLEAIDGQRH